MRKIRVVVAQEWVVNGKGWGWLPLEISWMVVEIVVSLEALAEN